MSKKGVCRQIFVTVAASFSIFIGGMWMGWPCSVVEKFIKHETDIDMDIAQLSWIVSVMDLGNVISPLFAGYLADKIGRKLCVIVLGPFFAFTWLLTLYFSTFWSLYLARLLAGVAKGISYTVVPIFLGEISGVEVRGALSTIFCLQLYAGTLLEVVIGPVVSYRALNTMSTIVSAFFILMIVWIPESPYYLLKKNRLPEATKSLQWLRCDSEVEVDAEIQQMDIGVKKDMENRSTFVELFSSRKDIKALTIVIVACISQRAGGMSCLLVYSVVILPEPAPIMERFGYTILFFAMVIVFSFVGMAIVDKVGRKPLLILSEVGTGFIMFILALYFYLSEHMDVSCLKWLPYLCHVLFSIMFAIGVSFIPVIFLGELFPVNVRSHCSAVVSIILASCSFIVNKIFLLVSLNYGYQTMFGFFTVINFCSAFYTYKYTIETKGKTFLEIQEMLKENVTRDNDSTKN